MNTSSEPPPTAKWSPDPTREAAHRAAGHCQPDDAAARQPRRLCLRPRRNHDSAAHPGWDPSSTSSPRPAHPARMSRPCPGTCSGARIRRSWDECTPFPPTWTNPGCAACRLRTESAAGPPCDAGRRTRRASVHRARDDAPGGPRGDPPAGTAIPVRLLDRSVCDGLGSPFVDRPVGLLFHSVIQGDT